MNTEIENTRAAETERPEQAVPPEKAAYVERIRELPAEDQAFMDGYLFAIVKNAKKRA